MAKMSVARAAGAAAESLAQQMGFIFVDAELTREHGAAFLRVFVDAPGGMSLDKCESFHRALVKQIGDMEYDYLEVSSPGLDRPLKRPPDFERNLGRPVEAKLFQALDGQKTVTGKLLSYDEQGFTLESDQGLRYLLKKDCTKIAPVLNLEEELRQAESAHEQEEEEESNE